MATLDSLFAARESVRFAAGALMAHKLRSALTIIGIVIGVTTVIAMVSIIEGFNNTVIESFKSFGATLVQFQKFDAQFGPGDRDPDARARKNLTYEDALALKAQCPSMLAVSPERYWFNVNGVQAPDVIYKGQSATPDTVVGVSEDYSVANNHFVAEGRFITAGDLLHARTVTVIGYGIADALFPRSDPVGKEVAISGRKYLVVGVMEKQGASFFESTDSHVYLPITTFDTHYPWIKKGGRREHRHCAAPAGMGRQDHRGGDWRAQGAAACAVQQAERLRNRVSRQADRKLQSDRREGSRWR